MAGSKGGKHSKSKGKYKSKKSDAINQQPEPLNSRIDSTRVSNGSPDEPKDSKDKNPHPNMNSSMTTGRSNYTENELEQFLLLKLERSYLKAKGWLLASGYGLAEIDRAILNAGHINSSMDLQNNLLTNLLSFIEGKFEPQREAFKDIDVLYKTVLKILVFGTMQARPDMNRSDAMWILLDRNWGSLPPTAMTSHLQSGSHGSSSRSKNENAEKVPFESSIGVLKRVNLKPALVSRLRQNVPILTDALHAQIGAPVIKQQAIPNASGFFTSIEGSSFVAFLRAWLESDSDDDSITPQLVDLVKNIINLYEKVNEQKEWAQKKVIGSAKSVSKHLLELQMLRMETVGTKQLIYEKMCAEKAEALATLKIMQRENCLHCADCEVNHLTEAVRRLETKNAAIRADMEAFKLNASESERDLKVVMKRERKCMKKLAEIEKQKSIFQEQCEAEKQVVLQLEVELLQAEKVVEEAEITWRQEIVEKEQMFALLAEEIKMEETQKANSRSELLKLRQKLEIDSQLAQDDCRRLEDELSSLRLAHRMSDVFLKDDIFLYRSLEGTSSESSAPYEKIGHWNCMICIDTEVDVVFLPCTHQVVCFSCYEGRCKMQGECPYCGAQIEQSIRVYGQSS
ncbi:hypothetical protein BUALT_Bualt01G0185200 [Buddleja alternifolia]|uniref:RING-type domain-containing protein n=1 Tax=Buddleja alternifolia TaxID=168488 RepID=A0AAV6YCE6_9LAMI|nr:hypothetical protein BUALT_Bualt01G0185200 [Buddleja alternifolia]